MAGATRRQFVQQAAFASASLYGYPAGAFADTSRAIEAQKAAANSFGAGSNSKLTGHIITPASPDYETARLVFNRAFDLHPALIVRCNNASDVIRALDFAQRRKLPIAVRSGGHSRAGFGVCEGGMVIDLSEMTGVEVDAGKRLARVQAGARVRDLDRATRPFGLATTAGGCTTVGLAGFTLGGGQGLLMSMFGAACDNLVSARVVTTDGRQLEASEDSNADLFWAIRGGGGNFGIVTALEYRLHPMGNVLSGALNYPAAGRIPELMHQFAQFAAAAPDEMVPLGELLSSDDGPRFINHLGYVGDPRRGNQLIEPLRALKPYEDTLKAMPYWDAQAAGFTPAPVAHFQTNLFLPQLNSPAIDAIAMAAANAPRQFRILFVPLFGAITRKRTDATAFALRERGIEVDLQGRWSTPAEKADAVRWVNALHDRLKPFARGLYVNQIGETSPDLARTAYGPNYARLAQLKRKYDPENVLRLNLNIAPG